ncbi:MAG: 50S ribosomal protein L31e [Candidatus Anstonellaceae archaeon]
MAVLERIYNIPLGDAYLRVRNKRAKRAIDLVRAFALRHMKAKEVRISQGTNKLIFRDGIKKPPRKIKVRIVKGEDDIAWVWLIGEEEKLKEAEKKKEQQKVQQQKEAKPEAKAEEAAAVTQEKSQAPQKKAAEEKPQTA